LIKLDAYKISETHANITPLSGKRDWMDQTMHKHAYRCFPLTLSNQIGWGLSFPEDITFMWDGIISTSPYNIQVIQGEKYCETGRGHATINFKTNLRFVTDKNYSLLSFPVPNSFTDGAQAITSILSSSFFEGPLPVAWKVTRAFTPITIKANEPFIAIMPVSLSELNNSVINIDSDRNAPTIERKIPLTMEGAMEAVRKANEAGTWTDHYRDAVDYMGNVLGEHEVKSIKLGVKDLT
jgi:hypothetical protein